MQDVKYYVYQRLADVDGHMVDTKVHVEIGGQDTFVYASMAAADLSRLHEGGFFVRSNWESGIHAAFVNGIPVPVNH